MATTRLVTVDGLYQVEDGYRYDLIRGELYRMPPAGDDHGSYAGRLSVFVGRFIVDHRLGNIYVAETGFVLARDPDTVVAPDVAFVRADRLSPERDRRRFLQIAPDFAIEIISPSETARMAADKIAAYQEAGVPLLWMFYPGRRHVAAYRQGQQPVVLGEDGTLDGDDILPGLRIPVKVVFA